MGSELLAGWQQVAAAPAAATGIQQRLRIGHLHCIAACHAILLLQGSAGSSHAQPALTATASQQASGKTCCQTNVGTSMALIKCPTLRAQPGFVHNDLPCWQGCHACCPAIFWTLGGQQQSDSRPPSRWSTALHRAAPQSLNSNSSANNSVIADTLPGPAGRLRQSPVSMTVSGKGAGQGSDVRAARLLAAVGAAPLPLLTVAPAAATTFRRGCQQPALAPS